MKILIFEVWHVSPQLETGLELAELHAGKNDDVHYVNIGGKLPYIEWYHLPRRKFMRCFYTFSVKSKIKKAQELCDPKIKFYTSTKLSQNYVKELNEELAFKDLDDLKRYQWKNIDIGLAAVSSYITDTNEMTPDVVLLKDEFNDILWSSKIVAESFRKYLQDIKPDKVYFRNGRVSNYRPILRICQQEGVKFEVHDRASGKNLYSLGPTYRHDWRMRQNEMLKHWDESQCSDKEVIGAEFFEERRRRENKSHKVFAKGQQAGQLPESWDESCYNVVFFNSSISEYAAVGDEANPHRVFSSQEEAVFNIESVLSRNPKAKFYIRLHPNLLNQSKQEQDLWNMMGSDNIELIPADSLVDTYALIDHADLVICYLSTTGIEAVYAKKPVILLGRSLYDSFDLCYTPNTKEELEELLVRSDLPTKFNYNIYKYGYYMRTHGIPFVFYQAIDHRNGLFKGVNLQRHDFKQMFERLGYYISRIKLRLGLK